MRWDQEEVFTSGDRFFERLILEIQKAVFFIYFETYCFENDTLGKRILDSLAQAAKRGVDVKLLIDGIGSLSWSESEIRKLNAMGIQTRVYHPLPWQSQESFFGPLRFMRQLGSRLSHLNRRNHRKSCLIDQRCALMGGMNVSAKHLKELNGPLAWRDFGVFVRGGFLRDLRRAFLLAWRFHDILSFQSKRNKKRVKTKPRADSLIRLNYSRKARKIFFKDLVFRILAAEKTVWITTPYFVPEISLLRALRFAAWSGVDVRLLFPRRNDIFFMKWISQAYYSILHRAGVRIYEYLPSVLHAKTCMIDDWVMVGSSNLNHRSLICDLEVDVVLTHPVPQARMKKYFLEDLRRSEEIFPRLWSRRFWFKRVLEWLALKMRRWV